MADVIVIGAGPAGLACGAMLRAAGLDPLILEREAQLGPAWRRHYDRLHLHTDRRRSHLPGMAFPESYGRYVSRDDVVRYLEDYAARFDLAPRLTCPVMAVRQSEGGWRVETPYGGQRARAVVFATGISDRPHIPDWPGLAELAVPVLHSRDYRNPGGLHGRRVLVVGFGNSGGEIALDLANAGRDVTMAVRGPVNILPQELFGLPIGNYALLQRILPYRWADAITAPVLRLKLGDITRTGLQKLPKGPIAQVREDGRIPLIDLGTLDLIRRGRIALRPGVTRFDGNAAVFADDTRGEFDAVLLATGYRTDLRPLLGEAPGILDPAGRPLRSGEALAPGLWFCSYHPVPNGQLREIAAQSQRIAPDVATYLASARAPG